MSKKRLMKVSILKDIAITVARPAVALGGQKIDTAAVEEAMNAAIAILKVNITVATVEEPVEISTTGDNPVTAA
jgi:ribosomal protein S3